MSDRIGSHCTFRETSAPAYKLPFDATCLSWDPSSCSALFLSLAESMPAGVVIEYVLEVRREARGIGRVAMAADALSTGLRAA